MVNHGIFDEFFCRIIKMAVFLNFFDGHLRISPNWQPCKSSLLDGQNTIDLRLYLSRAGATWPGFDVLICFTWNINLDVDTVKEGTGDLFLVFIHSLCTIDASLGVVAVITARTGV